jgi:hypothetical protein
MCNTNEKIEAFKVELKALMQKHDFGCLMADTYDGNGDHYGTDHYFTIDSEPYIDESVAEIFDSIHKDLMPASPKVFIIN